MSRCVEEDLKLETETINTDDTYDTVITELQSLLPLFSQYKQYDHQLQVMDSLFPPVMSGDYFHSFRSSVDK